jgi:uncharacterized protein YbbC (DUF1343 family)
VVVFHAQDISHRAYTYKQALAETLTAVAGTGAECVVLDRPTPLGHLAAAGPCHPQFFPAPLPVILPVTLGELAAWLRRTALPQARLHVIPVHGWTRDMSWPESALPWIPPSPNIPSLDSAYAYACTGMLQHTSVAEGRGTCKPFEYIGAPFLDAAAVCAALNAQGLPGVTFREAFFTPAFNKFAGQLCHGVHLMFTDRAALEPFRVMLTLLRGLALAGGDAFELQMPTFAGWLDGEEWTTDRLRSLDVDAACAQAAAAARAFAEDIAPDLLYGPPRA